MKRVVAALMLIGTGLVAGSVVDAYPPGSATVNSTTQTPAPGDDFTITVDSCLVGEDVVFNFLGGTITVVCGPAALAGGVFAFVTAAPQSGTASATFTAPTAPGVYDGTATLVTSDVVLSFSIEVVAAATTTTVGGILPSTGSSSQGPAVTIAMVLLLGGAGLFGIAKVRRRRELPA